MVARGLAPNEMWRDKSLSPQRTGSRVAPTRRTAYMSSDGSTYEPRQVRWSSASSSVVVTAEMLTAMPVTRSTMTYSSSSLG